MLSCGVAYFVLLAAFAALLGTWTDEEYTLATTAHGFANAWQRAIDYELQAPLYFGVLALWREGSASVWFARLFSIVCATGFFFAIVPIVRRIAPERNPLWPALAISCNPFVIYTALDIRLYSAALLISALGWLTFEAGFVHGRGYRARLGFGILAVVALYTQYFLGFALLGYAAVLLVRGRFRTLVPYAGTLALIGVCTVPLLRIVRSQIGGSGETTQSALTLLPQTVHPWLTFLLPYEYVWDFSHLRTPHIALVVLLAVAIAFARPRLGIAFISALACTATIEALFIVVVLAFKLELNVRHYVVVFVPAMLAGYALFVALARSARPWVATLVASVYALLTVAVLYAQHHALAQSGDSKRVAAYLAAHAARNAVIAVFPADALPVYARQYHGQARLVPFPKPLPATRYDLSKIDVDDERAAIVALRTLRGAPQLWFVLLGGCENGAREYGCKNVVDAIADVTRVRSERHFFESRVFLLDVKP